MLAIDANGTVVQQQADKVTYTVQADPRSIESLRQIGAGEFSIAVVARGSPIEESMLIPADLVDLGVRDGLRASGDIERFAAIDP